MVGRVPGRGAARCSTEACELEIAYGRDTMPNGMLGLTAELCEQYMHFITNRRCRPDRPRPALRRDRQPVPLDERGDGPEEGEELLRDPGDRVPVVQRVELGLTPKTENPGPGPGFSSSQGPGSPAVSGGCSRGSGFPRRRSSSRRPGACSGVAQRRGHRQAEPVVVVVVDDLGDRAEAKFHGAAAEVGWCRRTVLEAGVEVVAVGQPVLGLGVQVDALMPGRLGDMGGGGEPPAGVAEVAAGLLRSIFSNRTRCGQDRRTCA